MMRPDKESSTTAENIFESVEKKQVRLKQGEIRGQVEWQTMKSL